MTIPAAVLSHLRAAVTPVYDGEVPLDPRGRPLEQRYAVLYADPGSRASEDLGRVADRYVHHWQVTSVGQDRQQAEWVAVRCRDTLLDQPLTADGWHVGTVEHTASSPIRRDDDLPGEPLFYAVDTYSLTVTR